MPRWAGERVNHLAIVFFDGLGDALMLGRYLPGIARRVDRLTVLVAQPLVRLFARLLPQAHVLPLTGMADAVASADAYITEWFLPSLSGAEKVIDIIGPGGTFGEALMFMERPYIVYARTLADSLLLIVHRSVVFVEIERNARFARKMIAGLCGRLHNLVKDVEAYSLHSGTQRLLGYLLREGKRTENGGLSVALPASKMTIASRLNLTPEHFSRILHELAHSGLIAIEGREVRIVDVEKLKGFSL